MTYRLVLAVTVALMAAGGTGTAQRETATPGWRFLGRWKANSAKSDMKGSVITFTAAASGEMTISYQGTKATFKIDGQERPAPLGTMTAWTQTGPRNWRTVWKMAGTVNNIDTWALSADGKTLTMDTEYLLPKAMRATAVFTRQSGGPGLPGVWKAETVQTDALELEMTAKDARTIQVAMLSVGGTATTRIDGTAAPMTGPATMVPPGMTVAVKVIDNNSFDLTVRMDGKRLSTARYKVSADGRSMVADAIGSPDSTPEKATFVFDRQ